MFPLLFRPDEELRARRSSLSEITGGAGYSNIVADDNGVSATRFTTYNKNAADQHIAAPGGVIAPSSLYSSQTLT